LTAEALQEAIQKATQPLLDKITQLETRTGAPTQGTPNGADDNGGFQGKKTDAEIAQEAEQKVNDTVAQPGFDFNTL
jgi:hypothetical protein